MVVAWWSYVRVAAMFWDGYLERVAAPAHVARGHAIAGKRLGAGFDIMMQTHHDALASNRRSPELPMRTTIDIPEREHALFTHLAHAQRTSLSKLIVELARRGLDAPARVGEEAAPYRIDPRTGFAVFRSGRPITNDDVKADEEEDDARFAGR